MDIAKGNIGERNRTLDFISGDFSDDGAMFYCLFTSDVIIDKEDGSESMLKWVITLIMKKDGNQWTMVHRQNTYC